MKIRTSFVISVIFLLIGIIIGLLTEPIKIELGGKSKNTGGDIPVK